MSGEGNVFNSGDWLIVTFSDNSTKEVEIFTIYPDPDGHGDEIHFKDNPFYIKYDGSKREWRACCHNSSRGYVSIQKKQPKT
jgi:hypothetical protein